MPPTTESHDEKQPIKWMDLPIMKFNEIAVPHHVTQLKALKISIQKCQKASDWNGAHREQMNAAVVVKQLHVLVREMDTLRSRVIDKDVHKFDKMIKDSRQAALNILQEFIDLSQQSVEIYTNRCTSNTDDSEHIDDERLQQCLDISDLSLECQRQEKYAITWENLQREIEEVHQLYEELANVVEVQGESVSFIENNVDVAHEEITQGEQHLREAAYLKAASYPLYGAIIGSCMGGPIGFLAGVKIGSLVAVAGSLLGFTGGRMLKMRDNYDQVSNQFKMK